jgi:DNA-binding NtrC family response regulator
VVGTSTLFRKVLELVQKVGNSDVAVLLQGESGTGKELVARMIYEVKPKGQFVPIDCGALPPNLVESELFGHERGAFTGALSARPGLLQAAHGGTAFFDEIGELPAEGQAKLLRSLQQQEIRPVGSDRSRPCRFRIIAATNRNLAEEVKAGKFRLDLYFRVNVVTLFIPPLRKRKEDIPELVKHFLEKADCSRTFGPELVQALSGHTWPGNIRELENCVARLVALSGDESLHVEDLPPWGAQALMDLPAQPGPNGNAQESVNARRLGSGQDTPEPGPNLSMDAAEQTAIERALALTNGNFTEAAKILGIGRATLYRRRQQRRLRPSSK